MKILKLRSENVKKVRLIEVRPDPKDPLVIVRGFNGEGKSSLIDSIKYAWAGKASHPPKVVRTGESAACVEIETEDLIVTRRWTVGAEATTTELEVRAKDGTKLPSAQKVLDKLCDELAFRALEFADCKKAEQLDLLKKLVGVDTGPLDQRRKVIFEQRTLVNRDLAAAEARLKEMPTTKPAPMVDTAALLKEQDEANRLQKACAEAVSERQAALRRMDDASEAVKVGEQALQQARNRLDLARKRATDADNIADAAEEAAEGTPATLQRVRAGLTEAQANAAANARWTEREKISADVERLGADTKDKTAAIEKIDADKLAMVAGAKFPIDGLGFGDDGVIYKNLPFEQASHAEQLRVSVAIGAARNPKFRVMTLEGSRLDSRSLVLLRQLAIERDLQVWLEAPGEDGPATVVIVDGEVRP
jgi:DNA repair exonuclease SbcCD ATPase subunit